MSHSVSFSDPLVNDDSDNASGGFSEEVHTNVSEEDLTNISEEGNSSVSEEGRSSLSEEGSSSISEEALSQVGNTVGIGAGATDIITQVGATEGAGAGVDTTLCANNDDTSNDATMGSIKDSNNYTNELDLTMPIMANLDAISLSCSKRNKPSRKLIEQQDPKVKKFFGLLTMFCLFSATVVTGCDYTSPKSVVGKIVLHAEKVNMHLDGTLNYIHHAALMTTSPDNDTYTYKSMLQQEDKNEFVKAMMKEIVDHESRKQWSIMRREDLPIGAKTILAIWSFNRKRFPDSRIQKYKARICAHGGMQTWGENYWETYAPVVNWLSVRTMMILSVLHDLETRSIDFTLDFPQAGLDVDIFYGISSWVRSIGPDSRRYVIKLIKSLYGLKQATHNWFELLKSSLEARGYDNQSATDPCVFVEKTLNRTSVCG